MLLATDLDGTFLGGNDLYKQELYRLVRENAGICLVYVTGRGLESVMPILYDPGIPNPEYIICDVGSTIVNGHTLEPVEPLQGEIEKKWPGSPAIMDCVSGIEGIRYQQVPQQRRCSFFADNDSVIEEVRLCAGLLDCDVIFSAGKFLDILPRGINKGSSLKKLVGYLGADTGDVLVAGDTLNDLAMYECGYKGVVVGNAEEKLKVATRNITGVHQAGFSGAGGIMEAIRYFKYMAGFVNPAEKEISSK